MTEAFEKLAEERAKEVYPSKGVSATIAQTDYFWAVRWAAEAIKGNPNLIWPEGTKVNYTDIIEQFFDSCSLDGKPNLFYGDDVKNNFEFIIERADKHIRWESESRDFWKITATRWADENATLRGELEEAKKTIETLTEECFCWSRDSVKLENEKVSIQSELDRAKERVRELEGKRY